MRAEPALLVPNVNGNLLKAMFEDADEPDPAKPADLPAGSAPDPVGRLVAGFESGAGTPEKVAG